MWIWLSCVRFINTLVVIFLYFVLFVILTLISFVFFAFFNFVQIQGRIFDCNFYLTKSNPLTGCIFSKNALFPLVDLG